MKRRILTLLVSAFVLLAFAFGFTACKTVEDFSDNENFSYNEVTENGAVIGYEVAGWNESEADGERPAQLEIPASYKNKPVLKIAEQAFYENELIESVTIPDTVAEIGGNAFYGCENLKSVTVGNGAEVIGELAFADCPELETVSLGSSVRVIDGYAFSQCSALKQINIPSSVESIGECAFVMCASLETADLPYGLKSIGDCAFGGCVSLASFAIPDSVTRIGWGVLMFDVGAVGFTPSEMTNCLTELTISDSVTEIPDFAFSKCNISSVEIGKSVTTIRYSSFYGCGLMQSVVIPKSVSRIESYAFYQCDALESVFYAGTAEEWAKITIGKNGNDISEAEKYYYSETQPVGEGNFWHYSDGVPVKW